MILRTHHGGTHHSWTRLRLWSLMVLVQSETTGKQEGEVRTTSNQVDQNVMA